MIVSTTKFAYLNQVESYVFIIFGYFISIFTRSRKCWSWLAILFLCKSLPCAYATVDQDSFPDIPFYIFSEFISSSFNQDVSLATVLTVLFTVIGNPNLLNLHARQQHPKFQNEKRKKASAWIIALAEALEEKIGINATDTLFADTDKRKKTSKRAATILICNKLDNLSKILELTPYNKRGVFQRKLKSVSIEEIEGAQVICPSSMECESESCKSRALFKYTRGRDMSKATLVRGTTIYANVPVLAGKCKQCKTYYYCDHERITIENEEPKKLYLNSAPYLKVGQSIWVDRIFSSAVLNACYQFHASPTAFTEFWNASFWATQKNLSNQISRRQIWQSFVQESIRRIAQCAKVNLEMPNSLKINNVTGQAFEYLGETGKIRSAYGHECSECVHEYKHQADIIDEIDPGGLVGIDDNRTVPEFTGRREATDVDVNEIRGDESMEMDYAPVSLVVMDGIVMGHKYCAYHKCTEDLANYRNGVFCKKHEELRGNLCHISNCNNPKIPGTKACQTHREKWYSHVVRFGRSSLLGVRRLLRRTAEEALDWLPINNQRVQPHDEPESEQTPRESYFTAAKTYCIETLCAPCGVVIAWDKFKTSESPTNIMDFLNRIYPQRFSRPAYVCIDKACMVLRYAVRSGRWNIWRDTTRLIVDSYHYINHRTSDWLCRIFCNPAPLNGSAPNLIKVEYDRNGAPHYKRAFNTQV
jgi:hypothetical protein